MPGEAQSGMPIGVLVYDRDRDCLLLDGQDLRNGTSIEIRVFDAWIPGQVARDSKGWYLITLDQVGIRLHTGLPARVYEDTLAIAGGFRVSQEQPSRILIVDDDPALLKALPRTITLRIKGTHVDAASSAQEALQMLLEWQYEAVVSDIKMPGMDGLELLDKVREHQPETPTLLITGHGEHDLAIRALRGGAYDYIQKPIDRDTFIAALLRAIQTCQLRRRVTEQQRTLELHARSLERLVQQRTQELVEAHAAKDKVISLVSHELEGPIARLKEITHLLYQKIEIQGREIVQRSFHDIEQSLTHTEELVQELQETTLIETRMFIPHRQQCDLVALCHGVLQEVVAANGAILEWSASDRPIDVEVDYDQIAQVLRTLLTRAHIFPQLEVAPTTITVQYSLHQAIITMRDLSSQMHLGVGFYVSRKILEQHEGHLEIQSFPGDRRTLFLTLPLLSSQESTDQQNTSMPVECANGVIRYYHDGENYQPDSNGRNEELERIEEIGQDVI